jgi:hypothetical protein
MSGKATVTEKADTVHQRPTLEAWRRVLAVALVAWPIALFGYALHARVLLGYWPAYGRPDPKDLHLPLEHSLVGLSLLGFTIAALALPSLFFELRAAKSTWREPRWLALPLLVALGAVILFGNVGGLLDWYLD